MQYSLKTLLVLFVLLGSSLAAFGAFGGIAIAALCVGVGVSCFYVRGPSCADMIAFALIVLILLALLLPARMSPGEAHRRIVCQSKLKLFGVALHHYHQAHGFFPPAVLCGNDGRPMHSWRILILPYSEEANLYRRYDFSEPWDGPNNQPWHTQVVSMYSCPSDKSRNPTRTNYFAVTGPGTAWPEGRGSRLDEFKDGPANTILLVEVADMDVHWMEPRDVTLDEALGPPDGETRAPQSRHYSEGSYFTRSMPLAGNILFADGSVRTVHKRLSRDDLAALLTIDGGEAVDLDRLLEPTLAEKLRWDRIVGLPLFVASTIWFWLCLRGDARAARESRENHRRDAETLRDE